MAGNSAEPGRSAASKAARRCARLGILTDTGVAYIGKRRGHSPVTTFAQPPRAPGVSELARRIRPHDVPKKWRLNYAKLVCRISVPYHPERTVVTTTPTTETMFTSQVHGEVVRHCTLPSVPSAGNRRPNGG